MSPIRPSLASLLVLALLAASPARAQEEPAGDAPAAEAAPTHKAAPKPRRPAPKPARRPRRRPPR